MGGDHGCESCLENVYRFLSVLHFQKGGSNFLNGFPYFINFATNFD